MEKDGQRVDRRCLDTRKRKRKRDDYVTPVDKSEVERYSSVRPTGWFQTDVLAMSPRRHVATSPRRHVATSPRRHTPTIHQVEVEEEWAESDKKWAWKHTSCSSWLLPPPLSPASSFGSLGPEVIKSLRQRAAREKYSDTSQLDEDRAETAGRPVTKDVHPQFLEVSPSRQRGRREVTAAPTFKPSTANSRNEF
ncbi:hypothetical protein EYF80_055895 [Liparis tanakae]|uniref:Uncharacterized protein n=1 Tax=Liparis tanakae TaxID=230148 RepID=A0A4Z2EZC2_9TELE|nr:hypothetical protein EYF80_055895 [Liparis tanakae]